MADPHAEVWMALQALPRPIDASTALATAATVLDPMGLTQQFTKWWDDGGNGDVVLRRLNG